MFGDSGSFGFDSSREDLQLDLLFVDSVAAFFVFFLKDRQGFVDDT